MIIILCHNLRSGGAQKVSINTYLALKKKKIKSKLIIINSDGELLTTLNKKDPDIIYFNFSKVRYFFFKLIKILNSNKDFVIFSMIREINLLLGFCKFLRLISNKIVGREANPVDNWEKISILKRTFYKFLLYFAYNSFDKLIFNSNFTKNSIYRFIHIHSRVPFRVIGNPIILSNTNEANVKNNYHNNHYQITNIGRLEHQKNQGYIIDAFFLAQKEKKNIYLKIIGSGSLLNKYQLKVKNLGIEDKVDFIPYIHDINTELNKTDLFVMASIFEGFGNVFVEALNNNCRILTLGSPGGISEILVNGKYGKIVPIDSNSSDFAREILKALQSKKNSNLKKRALDYDYLSIVDKYLEFIYE